MLILGVGWDIWCLVLGGAWWCLVFDVYCLALVPGGWMANERTSERRRRRRRNAEAGERGTGNWRRGKPQGKQRNEKKGVSSGGTHSYPSYPE